MKSDILNYKMHFNCMLKVMCYVFARGETFFFNPSNLKDLILFISKPNGGL